MTELTEQQLSSASGQLSANAVHMEAGRWGAAAYRWGQSRSLLGGSRPATRVPSIPASIGGGQLMQPWRRPPDGVPAIEVDKLREGSMPAIQERHKGLLWSIPRTGPAGHTMRRKM